MSRRWIEEHRRDPWRRKARSEGYRSRSAFKLKQVQEKFEVLRKGDRVLDVGCHPGGWTQVAVEQVGASGVVVGVDLEPCAYIPGAILIVGDITDADTQVQIREAFNGEKLNAVVSDISPGISGHYERDEAIALELVAMVADFSLSFLAAGGTFVTKLFQGRGSPAMIEALRTRFSRVQRFSPAASRKASSEVYVICVNRLPKKNQQRSDETISGMVEASLRNEGLIVDVDSDEEISGEIGFSLHRRKSRSCDVEEE